MDVGPTLYKCHTNLLCLLGNSSYTLIHTITARYLRRPFSAGITMNPAGGDISGEHITRYTCVINTAAVTNVCIGVKNCIHHGWWTTTAYSWKKIKKTKKARGLDALQQYYRYTCIYERDWINSLNSINTFELLSEPAHNMIRCSWNQCVCFLIW